MSDIEQNPKSESPCFGKEFAGRFTTTKWWFVVLDVIAALSDQ